MCTSRRKYCLMGTSHRKYCLMSTSRRKYCLMSTSRRKYCLMGTSRRKYSLMSTSCRKHGFIELCQCKEKMRDAKILHLLYLLWLRMITNQIRCLITVYLSHV